MMMVTIINIGIDDGDEDHHLNDDDNNDNNEDCDNPKSFLLLHISHSAIWDTICHLVDLSVLQGNPKYT
jgi:hypothetical protein